MTGSAANARFLPLAGTWAGEANEFELLLKVQDAEIFALIDPPSDVPVDDEDRRRTGDLAKPVALEKACSIAGEIEIRDAQITLLKGKLSECQIELEALRLQTDARHQETVEAAFSTLSETMASICEGMQTAVTDAICSEIARIVAPFAERSLVKLSVAELETAMTQMLDGSADGLFLISGPRDALEKLSPLFEANKFQFKFTFVDSSEVIVEYDNHLLSTRLDHWAKLLRSAAVE